MDSLWDRNRIAHKPTAASTLRHPSLQKLLIFFIAIPSLLTAANTSQMQDLKNRIDALEGNLDPKTQTINPAIRPVVKDGLGLFLQFDVLFWQASESDLGYGVQNLNGHSFLNDGEILIPHFEWGGGFKIGLGYNIPYDGWDLFFQWTRFYTNNGSHGVSAEDGGIIYPTYVNAELLTTINHSGQVGPILSGFQGASSFWNLKLNLLDGELGREFRVRKWLTLRPYGGLRSAWIRQRFQVNYSNGTVFSGTLIRPFTGQNLSVHMKNNFWGLGLRGGVDSDWGFGEGFSAFGNLAASLLVGQFKIEQIETRTTASPIETRLNITDTSFVARPILDMILGLRYESLLYEDRYFLELQLAWEQHLFFKQNQLMKFPVSSSGLALQREYPGLFVSNHGDLDTHGITLTARFAF